MSLKFERDTLQQVQQGAATMVQQGAAAMAPMASGAPPGGSIPGTTGRHPIAEVVGTALTGGMQNAGNKGYLAVRPILPDHRHLPIPPVPIDAVAWGSLGLAHDLSIMATTKRAPTAAMVATAAVAMALENVASRPPQH